jgi:hypothetical protein
MKSSIANPEYEIISKLQISMSKCLNFGVKLFWGLVLEVWNLPSSDPCLNFNQCEKKPLSEGAFVITPRQSSNKIHLVMHACQAEI